jgi:hypothetical protein
MLTEQNRFSCSYIEQPTTAIQCQTTASDSCKRSFLQLAVFPATKASDSAGFIASGLQEIPPQASFAASDTTLLRLSSRASSTSESAPVGYYQLNG